GQEDIVGTKFSNWLLQLEDGCISEIECDNNYISLPTEILIKSDSFQGQT
ncbi:20551_t:CDS:2, partial [Gigaspora rosea]